MPVYQSLDFGSVVPGFAAVRRLSDGKVILFDGQNPDFQAYKVWLSAGNLPDGAPGASVVSVSAFWTRFTPAEQAAIQAAASTDPLITNAITFALARGFVDLVSGPFVTQFMNRLVTAGVLTPARVAVILSP